MPTTRDSSTHDAASTAGRYHIAEITVLVISVVLGAALIGAIRAEQTGDEWHPAAVAVLSAGLGAALMSAITLPMVIWMTRTITKGQRSVRSEVDRLVGTQRTVLDNEMTLIAEVARLRDVLRMLLDALLDDADVIRMPSPDSLQAARALARQVIAAERRRFGGQN